MPILRYPGKRYYFYEKDLFIYTLFKRLNHRFKMGGKSNDKD